MSITYNIIENSLILTDQRVPGSTSLFDEAFDDSRLRYFDRFPETAAHSSYAPAIFFLFLLPPSRYVMQWLSTSWSTSPSCPYVRPSNEPAVADVSRLPVIHSHV